MDAVLWLLVGTPVAVGGALLVAGRRADRVASRGGVGTIGLVLALASVVAVARPAVEAPLFAGLPAGLAVDGLSALLVVTVAAVTLAVLVFASADPEVTEGEDAAPARFTGLVLVFAGAMLVTVTATTVPVLLMAWEVMGATSYALIGYHWRESARVRAGQTAFLTTRAADLGMYAAAGAALAGTGTLTLDRLADAEGGWVHLLTAGVVLAALGKSAQLPFSFWLSRAMAGPSPVSALLHSATMVAAGAYLLLRLEPVLVASGWGAPLVAWVGAATALVLGLVAVAQRDLKQLLAASTCAQVGFMVLAAGAAGVAAGAGQLVAHAAVKSLLFLVAGVWLAVLGTQELDRLRGAGRVAVGARFLAGAAALAGLPPLALWASKDAVLAVARHESTALYVVALAATAVSAAYVVRVVGVAFAPPAEGDAEAPDGGPTRQLPVVAPTMTAPVGALAVPAVLLGVLAVPPVGEAFTRLVGAGGEPMPAWWEPLVSAVVVVLGAAVALRAGVAAVPSVHRGPAVLTGWLGVEHAVHAGLVRPTLALARVTAVADDRVVAGAVRGAAAAGRATARLTDVRLETAVARLVALVAGGCRALGRLARRPQTGQLHQYYAQATAVLAVCVVVLVVVR